MVYFCKTIGDTMNELDITKREIITLQGLIRKFEAMKSLPDGFTVADTIKNIQLLTMYHDNLQKQVKLSIESNDG